MKNRPIYFPYLDSLRGISVIMVMAHHYIPKDFWWNGITGAYGVTLFFVLSGFLITRILIKDKIEITDSSLSLKSALKRFYYRRSLRIFPIYYLLVILCFFVNAFFIIDLKGSLLSFLFYFQNIYFYYFSDWGGVLTHTWTLAVEEQFYLIWPLLFLLIPSKKEYYLIAFLFAVDLYLNLTIHKYAEPLFLGLLTPYNLGSFMVGAFLAKEYQKQNKVPDWVIILATCMFLLGVLLMYLGIGFKYYLITFLPICYALTTKQDWLKTNFLANPALQYIGKISYGLYLYHYPIYSIWPIIKNKLYPVLHLPLESWLVDLPFLVGITFIVAYLSWNFIEKSILKYKDRFNPN